VRRVRLAVAGLALVAVTRFLDAGVHTTDQLNDSLRAARYRAYDAGSTILEEL
jgi:hypothetical protein